LQIDIKEEIFFLFKDINEYQFDQYECRGENILGEKSEYIQIEQSNNKVLFLIEILNLHLFSSFKNSEN